jgi:hypothetical protein
MQYRDIPKLRGYFSNKFAEFPQIHNHLPDGSYNYKYPQIQYRIVEGKPALLFMGEAVSILKEIFFNIDKIKIDWKKFNIYEKQIEVLEEEFGQSARDIDYEFISPWMALNEANFQKYKNSNKIEQQQLLKKILRGNLLTISKGFKYTIPNYDDINVEGYFKPLNVNFKNIKMLCFTGRFTVNFQIPDYLGLGKQSARGFGVVKHAK